MKAATMSAVIRRDLTFAFRNNCPLTGPRESISWLALSFSDSAEKGTIKHLFKTDKHNLYLHHLKI